MKTAVFDIRKKVVPDKGCLNEEFWVAKAPTFPSSTGKNFFMRNGMDSMR